LSRWDLNCVSPKNKSRMLLLNEPEWCFPLGQIFLTVTNYTILFHIFHFCLLLALRCVPYFRLCLTYCHSLFYLYTHRALLFEWFNVPSDSVKMLSFQFGSESLQFIGFCVLMVYLILLSVSQTILCWMIGWLMNNELGRKQPWINFMALSWNLHGGTDHERTLGRELKLGTLKSCSAMVKATE
jgi:hypothetical protein